MKNEAIISVIVPVYNANKYLNQCIDSILNQSFKCFELILIDDGSTDNCPSICDEYAKKDNRVVVIHQTNEGVSGARNAGLDYLKHHSNGQYLTFIDSDDWVDEDYLESLFKYLKKYNVDIVCGAFVYDSNAKHRHWNINKERVFSSLEATNILLLDETVQSHVCTKLYKTTLWENVRFDETVSFMEDQCTTYKVFYRSASVMVTNYSGYHYRKENRDSLTKSITNSKKALSGLKGYYFPCLFDSFSKDDKSFLLPSMHNALANAYLMLIPYYRKKAASDEDKVFIKGLKKYLKDNKVIAKYAPKTRNNALKKRIYTLCPSLYPYLFKLGKFFLYCGRK